MKISVILPSLFPTLARRAIDSLRAARRPNGIEVEIVVVSPQPPTGPDIVGVEEVSARGNNPANRAGFDRATGDAILCISDDITVTPDIWEVAQECLAVQLVNKVISMDAQRWHCFDKLYATFPLAWREVIEQHKKFFYPYKSHWGDVALSLDVWRTRGVVLSAPRPTIVWKQDRMGMPEPSHKWRHFQEDYEQFKKDFSDLSAGYDLGQVHTFNHPQ